MIIVVTANADYRFSYKGVQSVLSKLVVMNCITNLTHIQKVQFIKTCVQCM